MCSKIRKLKFSLAINEALHQTMEKDKSVFIIGQGVKSPWYVGNTCTGLVEKFTERRVIDTPVSENAMTGAAVGAAIAGMRPIVVHPRMDFMIYAFDPIINEAANWHYMTGGKTSVPVVFWGIINRGGEQAAQHSQALQSIFAHVPGLKVVMPSTAYDAKGLLISSILDDNPVVFIDDRFLYDFEDDVPEEMYMVNIGEGIIRKSGKDITIVSVSYMMIHALRAAEKLKKQNINAEVIDLRTVKPFDKKLILKSIKKTGKLLVVDSGWKSFGISAEISASIAEEGFDYLKAPIGRVALEDCPAPACRELEDVYYKNDSDIIQAVLKIMKKNK
jgi:acetoin:2,6-dichlorophenolindophenol oxidoreductase subunit beta